MKGIILHGGHGTRLRPLTHTGPKQLLPIANKPMSKYALEDLKSAGITEIGIITGGIYPEKVEKLYGNGEKFGVKISYIYQEKPIGIAHAIKLCKNFVGNENFVVYLGDNLLMGGINRYKLKFEQNKPDAMILLTKVNEPEKFGVATIEDGKIKTIVEKPKNSNSNLAVTGIYFLTPKIFEIIENLEPSARGELEITDALNGLLQQGFLVKYDFVTDWWKDTGTPKDILDANKLILDNIITNKKIQEENYDIQGKFAIGQNSVITADSLVEGPVIIGPNCQIGPSVRLGKNVSIGNNSIIKYCTIENSIIMDGCIIESKIHIKDSILAHGSIIRGNSRSKEMRFLLGEKSQIDF